MRVLYFHQHFSTPKGAGGIRSYQMARRLIERGHEVTMVSGRHASGQTGLEGPFRGGLRRGRVDGIDVIEVDLAYSNRDGFLRRAATFLRFILRTMKVIFTERYDLLFATSTPLTVGVPGIAARWLLRKPFVFEVRDLWPELPRAMGVIRNPIILSGLSILEWCSYRSADRLVGLSPGIVDGIKQRGIPHARVELIPNGCDLDIFGAGAEPWRPDGVSISDVLALFSGTHGIANGLDAVLDAAAELRRRSRDDIKILLIGDGMLKPRLRSRAAAEGLSNVIFHDPVEKHRLAGLLAGADIGLQVLLNIPAFYNGTSPNKFFDYIAAGLPVLNNYPGWLAELIGENGCGCAVPPEDPVAFADALEIMADDRSARNKMGENARALAQRSFDRDYLGELWVNWVVNTV